ncbi:MAG: AarF/ABC1/UbiB kinase family protein [Hyphomicrobiaceae bacterium]|nr:AarF/ABC1/UbiB kinase family protein [Hyphomicrobiaceae bacterium]
MNYNNKKQEHNRLSARASRYFKVSGNAGVIAAKVVGQRLLGFKADDSKDAAEMAKALGQLKGPIMKVAQLLSTIPEALPPEYARELAQLQANAPPMGPSFVKRRMIAEIGADWLSRLKNFDMNAAASASLGQVHKAIHSDGRILACKLQYPDMQSAVEADVNQLGIIFSIHARFNPAVNTREILKEIAARLREELDYHLEAKHMALYATIFAHNLSVNVPDVLHDLSTKRLLTMTWLDGQSLMAYRSHTLEDRNIIAKAMFRAWWYPFSHYGVIHGDPHLGNYTVFENKGRPSGINLLDYGCIRTFAPTFVKGVIDLYNGLLHDDKERIVHSYETWGFKGLTHELIDAMNIWAKFIYGPLLDDRERTIAEGTAPGEYGRKEAFTVHKILKEKGPVTVPREFVFMDRAAIGLGGVFLHLKAKLNWYRMFNETIKDFELDSLTNRQHEVFTRTGVPLPTSQ